MTNRTDDPATETPKSTETRRAERDLALAKNSDAWREAHPRKPGESILLDRAEATAALSIDIKRIELQMTLALAVQRLTADFGILPGTYAVQVDDPEEPYDPDAATPPYPYLHVLDGQGGGDSDYSMACFHDGHVELVFELGSPQLRKGVQLWEVVNGDPDDCDEERPKTPLAIMAHIGGWKDNARYRADRRAEYRRDEGKRGQ